MNDKAKVPVNVTDDAADRLDHKPRCRGAGVGKAWWGKAGDVLIRCRGCSRVGVVDASVVIRPAAGRYACRAHYEPVSWRGTGCDECAAERVAARRRRAAQRAARKAREAAAAEQEAIVL